MGLDIYTIHLNSSPNLSKSGFKTKSIALREAKAYIDGKRHFVFHSYT